jgi:hypothetical protein
MTFIPTVITKVDNNNSCGLTGATGFFGTSTSTSGYNSIQVTINSDSNSIPLGLQIFFSDNGTIFYPYYSDTFFNNAIFSKKYIIQKLYYYIQYTASVSSTINITTQLSTTEYSTENNSISTFTNPTEGLYDAFGKLRVSTPQTLLEIKFPGQTAGATGFLNNSLQVCTASTGTYSAPCSNAKCIIGGTGPGYFISQSRNFCVYQAGKSLLINASGIIKPGNTAFVGRIGYFFNSVPLANPLVVEDGLYFEYGTTMKVCYKNDELEEIPQSDWNIDKMDGTGSSGLNLNFSKCQLFLIDMEWLGVGRIRFGFYAYGKVIYCHQVSNINALTLPYTKLINLPLCYSLHSSTAGATATGSITQICGTVLSEGGYTPVGRPFTATSGLVDIETANIEIPILMLRGGTTNYFHQNIIPTNINITDNANNIIVTYYFRIYRDGNTPFPGGTIAWNPVDTNYSVSQYARTSTGTFSSANSILVHSGDFISRSTVAYGDLSSVFSSQILQITSNILNVSDILCLSVSSLSTSSNIAATLSWNEYY